MKRTGFVFVVCFFLFSASIGSQDSKSAVDAGQSAMISSIDRRVSNVEATHPDAISERLKNLEARVDEQQKLLWGILAAVIVNLLTGGAKIPFTIKRKREGD